jgi:hypothetical protein
MEANRNKVGSDLVEVFAKTCDYAVFVPTYLKAGLKRDTIVNVKIACKGREYVKRVYISKSA